MPKRESLNEPAPLAVQASQLSKERAKRRRTEAVYWKDRPPTDTLLRVFCESVQEGEAEARRDHEADEPLVRLKSPRGGMSDADYSELVRHMRGAQSQAMAERRCGATQRSLEQFMQARFPGIQAGEIKSVQRIAVAEQKLVEWTGPGGVLTLTWAGRKFLEELRQGAPPAVAEQAGAFARKRRWTQAEVNAEIANYMERARESIRKAKRDIQAGKRGSKAKARKLFGRNSLAKRFHCSGDTVSKSMEWRLIAEQLGLTGQTPGVGRGERVGLDVAIERKSEAEHRRLAEIERLAGAQIADGAAEKRGKAYPID